MAASGVDAGDPEPAHVTLASAAIRVAVAQRVHDCFVGGAVVAAAMPVVAPGLFEYRLVAFAGVNRPFDSCHGVVNPFVISADRATG